MIEYQVEFWRAGELIWVGQRYDDMDIALGEMYRDNPFSSDECRLVEVTTSKQVLKYVFKQNSSHGGFDIP